MSLIFDRVIKIVVEDRTNGERFTIGNLDPLYEGNKISFQVEKQISTEPNVAFVELYNLADSTRSNINYKQSLLSLEFGNKIEVIAGYRGQEKRIFSGVIVFANSPRQSNTFVTRINARNIFYELTAKKISRTVSKNQRKDDFVISVLKDIGATIQSDSIKTIRDKLQGAKFADSTLFFGTAQNIINEISENLIDRIDIYFDDIGVNFNPLGVPLDIPTIEYSKNNGLLETPEITETGVDFKVALDPNLRINSPIKLDSETIRAINPGGKYVVKKVIHVGTNRADDVFETRAQAIYESLKLQRVS